MGEAEARCRDCPVFPDNPSTSVSAHQPVQMGEYSELTRSVRKAEPIGERTEE